MRVERPPADEIPPPPAHLEASVRRPTAGIGPEARLAGLDERTELRIIVPRCASFPTKVELRTSKSLWVVVG